MMIMIIIIMMVVVRKNPRLGLFGTVVFPKNVASIATVAYSKDNKDSQNVQSVCIQFIHNQVFDRI